MQRFGRWRTVLGTTLVALAVLAGAAWLGARTYLSSRRVACQAADRLRHLLGANVEVGEANVGLTGDSSLQNVKVFEPDAKPGAKPFLRIHKAHADVSALDLARGARPSQLTLRGAHLTLRVDRAGKLLTRLPEPKGDGGPLPQVRIEGARLTLEQEGRAPLELHGINAELSGGDDGPKLEGTIADRSWGDWKAGVTYATQTGALTLKLETSDAAVTQAKLEALPYVPAHVWEEVKAEGRTPVWLTVSTYAAKSDVHYRVELEPRDVKVRVTAIDLEAEQAHGKVVVEDGALTLRGVKGRAAGGRIATDAELDFRGEASKMHFDVHVRNVVLSKLPKSWKVPDKFDGKLTGRADLRLTVRDGKVQTRGTGKGVIDDAQVLGFPAKEPIELRLHADGKRFRFSSPTSLSRAFFYTTTPALSVTQAPKGPPAAEGVGAAEVVRQAQQAPQVVAGAISKAAGAAARVLSRLSRLDMPKPTGKEPSYLEANLSLEDIDLRQLVQRLGVKLAFPLEGRLTIRMRLGVPLDTPRDLKAYRLKGTATLPRLNVGGLELAQVKARVDYAGGVLRLEELSGEAPRPKKDGKAGPAGTFVGHARVGVVPQTDLAADLKVDGLPLDVLLGLLPGAKGQAKGDLTGTVRFSAPVAKLREPASWKGDATLRSKQLDAYGLALDDAEARVKVDGGVATLSELKGQLEGAPVRGSASVQLKDDYPFQGKLALQRFDLAASRRLAPGFRPPFPVRGTVRLDANLRGTLRPVQLASTGTARADDLVVDKVKVDEVSFNWAEDAAGLQLSAIKARLYQGEVTGAALVPTNEAAAGHADLRAQDVDIQGLLQAWPSVPVRVEGRASGTVKARLSAAAPGKPRALSSDVELRAPSLRVQGIPADRLKGTVGYHQGVVAYRLEGETLGGKFKLEGKLPPPKAAPAAPPAKGAGGPTPAAFRAPAEPPPDGRFQLEGARLSRLVAALGPQGPLGPLRGRLSIDLPFRHEGPGGRPAGQGRFRVLNLRWNDAELAEDLQGDLVLSADAVQLRDVSGSLTGGSMRVQVVYNLSNPRRNFFNLALSGADARRLLVVVPGLGDEVQGTLDASLRGTFGAEWRGGGTVTLTRGRVGSVEVGEWRLPVDFTFVPGRGHGEVTVRDSGAHIGGGRATFRASLTWGGGGPRVEGNVRLIDAGLRSLLAGAGDVSSYAQGRVTGRADFGGDNVRSVNDLTANVQATLSQTQALQLPVFRQLAPFLPGAQSSSTFQSGELKGRLAGGVLRVQGLTLTGTYLRLFAQGSVTLQGRLDLDVVARTGSVGPDPLLLRFLRLRLPPVGPVPVPLLVQASTYLSNHVVRLRVNGTVRNPVARIEPVQLLTEEAVRYFVLRSVLPAP
jgi:translocation and assembly module TamB